MFNESSMRRLSSCYNKCLKVFFNFRRSDSMTQILLHFSLPSFKTIVIAQWRSQGAMLIAPIVLFNTLVR